MRRLSYTNLTALALGLALLYAPIVILVVYSFNASRLVTVWGGWSTRWYAALLEDRAMIDAALASLGIATVSAALATVLGTMAALALVRFRFRGRLPFAAMIYAPLVMPEVITGLSLLLLFVAIDLDRGFFTIIIAHTTLTMCFVTVIVQAALKKRVRARLPAHAERRISYGASAHAIKHRTDRSPAHSTLRA